MMKSDRYRAKLIADSLNHVMLLYGLDYTFSPFDISECEESYVIALD